MDQVNRRMLAERIADRSNRTPKEADQMVGLVLSAMGEVLLEGKRVNITGFGSLAPKVLSERMGRNPKTGENVLIGESETIRFRPAAALLEYLNGKEPPTDRPLVSKAPKSVVRRRRSDESGEGGEGGEDG